MGEELTSAGFWVRAGAAVIDGVVLLPVILALGIGLTALLGAGGTVLVRLACAAVPLAYYTVCFSRWGQTLGKAAAGVQVVARDGGPLGTPRALVRAMSYVLSTFLFLLGYAIAAFTPQKRALHDYLAGSRVVYPAPVSRLRKAVLASVGVIGIVVAPIVYVVLALAGRLPRHG